MRWKPLVTAIACLSLALPAFAQSPPKVVNARDGIFAAFQTHRLVGLGEWHGWAQQLDFYAGLVRDPRFAAEVGNVVVEAGNAAHQAVMDRYINGETVPYRELRKAWADLASWVPTQEYLGSVNLFAAIKAANQTLPPERRIKVWLGDPPIDWSKITTRADLLPWLAQRDSYPAALIEREILAKGKKALVIYGFAHLDSYPKGLHPGAPAGMPGPALRFLLETSHPGALYVVQPYVGFTTSACTEAFEKPITGLSAPSLLSPIRGSSLEAVVKRPECMPYSKPEGVLDDYWKAVQSTFSSVGSDAFLYLGPRQSLTESPRIPDLYLDLDFRAEIDRRQRARSGNGLNPIAGPAYNPASPRPLIVE